MVQVLAAHDGTGPSITYARSMLQTPQVFAWALVAVAYAVVIEQVVNRLAAWPGRPLRNSSEELSASGRAGQSDPVP